jgi:cell wall-associated NlpC family hydrolase
MKNRRITIPIISMVAACLATNLASAQSTATFTAPSTAPTSFTAPVTPSSTATTVTPSPGVTISTNKSAPPHSQPYTVVKGDSLTKLAAKFNTTRKKLEALNDLPTYKLTPGQVIFVPASAKKSAAAVAAAKKKLLAAAPVEDDDIPASTFASCPVPPSNDDDSDMVATYGKTPPIAPLVSPSEMQADQERQQREAAAQERLTATIAPPRLSLPPEADVASTSTLTPVVKPKTKAKAKTATTLVTTTTGTVTPQKPVPSPAPSGWANTSSHPMNSARPRPSAMTRMWNSITSPGSGDANMASRANDPSNAWGYKFLTASRELGDRGIDYDDNWRPPGEHSSWVMDCSNTSRWLYKSVTGINLPRTASDQYYYLHLQGKAWDVPKDGYGLPDVAYLQENLKPGDLLFWENTYKPERSPPITHVMVYLGTNDKGQWMMSGSQSSRGGEHNRRNGGPDVYFFRPSQPCGGWTGWFGTNRHVGRFCAFGRPLEADPSKFAVND